MNPPGYSWVPIDGWPTVWSNVWKMLPTVKYVQTWTPPPPTPPIYDISCLQSTLSFYIAHTLRGCWVPIIIALSELHKSFLQITIAFIRRVGTKNKNFLWPKKGCEYFKLVLWSQESIVCKILSAKWPRPLYKLELFKKWFFFLSISLAYNVISQRKNC